MMRYRLSALLLLLALLSGACSASPVKTAIVLGDRSVTRPEVSYFQADNTNIDSGASTVLRWDVTGADTIIIDGGVGAVPASGSKEISPPGLTAYNLTASNSRGTVVSSIIINVKPFVRIAGTTTTSSQSSAPLDALRVLPKLAANESYVFYGDAVMVGADEHIIVLKNNPHARNPTWAELIAFLQTDATDKNAYITGKYTCGDFAETLHNNAEAAGICAGIVAVELQLANPSDHIANHSLNMFDTVDRGLVYIDDTSSSLGYYADKIVDVMIGKDYIPVSIFPQSGQMQTWPSMGKVIAFDIKQW